MTESSPEKTSSSSARPPLPPHHPPTASSGMTTESSTAAAATATAEAASPPQAAPAPASNDGPVPVPNIVPSVLKKDSPKEHKRNVSWGALTRKLQQPDLGSNNDNGGAFTGLSGRITQEDLASRMPVETEAESYVLNSLENRDPTTTATGRSEKSILSNITDADLQALHSADSGSVTSARSAGRRTAAAKAGSKKSFFKVANAVRSQHRRKETVGDKLQGLAAAMDAVHLQHLDFLDDNLEPPMMDISTADKPLSSSADAFHHNTNLLFQRHSQRTSIADVESAASGYISTTPADFHADQGKTAEKRWKMLKHAVAASNMADKKEDTADTDNLGVPTATDDKNEKVSSEESSDDEGKGRRKKDWRARNKAEKVFRDLQDFVTPRQFSTYSFFKVGIFFIMLPSVGIAAILFYFAGNPPTGIVDLNRSSEEGILWNEDGDRISDKTASASWWLLFLGVREVSVILLAKFFELFFIDFLSVRSKFSVKVFGPWATLFILQTKGWPFIAFTWGLLSVGLLSGTRKFFHHWGYWQDYVDLFNENNPSGEVVDSTTHHRLVAIAIAVGLIVSAKRFWLGLHLGRQTFSQFSDRLAGVMKRILLVSEVASLGRAFERYANAHKDQSRRNVSVTYYGVNQDRLQGIISEVPGDDATSPGGTSNCQEEVDTSGAKYVIDPEDRHPMTGQLSQTQKARILTLLGQWSEPTLAEKSDATPTVNEILQFRRALEYLHTAYPFSGSFGLADRRESTIESAQEVYERLLLRSPNPDTLTFDVIALLGVGRDGELDCEKLKDLIKVFRPDRDGTMECVDFVKSVDEVYKELRLLRASVANSSKIDKAFESIFNFVFYAILLCLILSQLGYDPLALFLSISGVILAFAFMIGSASSKYFEGLLFILARRPYQIGDGIAIAGVNEQTTFTGSPMWVVEDVDLFTTNIVFSFTGEKATVSNGALAASRVINATISKEAFLYAMVKFPIEVSYEQLQIFKDQLTEFFKNRPREWIAFTRFRPTRFEIDQGFVEYIICMQHRLAWSNYGDLQQSKADLMHFCMELQKKMNLLYKQPKQPVDVHLRNAGNISDAIPQSPGPASPGGSLTAANAPNYAALQNLFAPKSE